MGEPKNESIDPGLQMGWGTVNRGFERASGHLRAALSAAAYLGGLLTRAGRTGEVGRWLETTPRRVLAEACWWLPKGADKWCRSGLDVVCEGDRARTESSRRPRSGRASHLHRCCRSGVPSPIRSAVAERGCDAARRMRTAARQWGDSGLGDSERMLERQGVGARAPSATRKQRGPRRGVRRPGAVPRRPSDAVRLRSRGRTCLQTNVRHNPLPFRCRRRERATERSPPRALRAA